MRVLGVAVRVTEEKRIPPAMKPHLPDTPFDVSSPALAVGATRTLPACVEPRCRAVRWVALVTAVCTCLLGVLRLSAEVIDLRPGNPTEALNLLFILFLFAAPSSLVGLAASFCHSRSGSLLLCLCLPMLFLSPLCMIHVEECIVASVLSLALTVALLILYPLFLLGEYFFRKADSR